MPRVPRNRNSETIELIKRVRSRRPLWDRSCKDHVAREGCWTDIAAETYADWADADQHEKSTRVRELKNKWRNVRDSYHKYLNEVNQTKGLSGRRKYQFADHLNFLGQPLIRRKRSLATSKNMGESAKNITLQGKEKGIKSSVKINPSTTNPEVLSSNERIKLIKVECEASEWKSQYVSEVSKSKDEDANKLFLFSLLSYYEKLNAKEKGDFRTHVLKFFQTVLLDKPGPDENKTYSSLYPYPQQMDRESQNSSLKIDTESNDSIQTEYASEYCDPLLEMNNSNDHTIESVTTIQSIGRFNIRKENAKSQSSAQNWHPENKEFVKAVPQIQRSDVLCNSKIWTEGSFEMDLKVEKNSDRYDSVMQVDISDHTPPERAMLNIDSKDNSYSTFTCGSCDKTFSTKYGLRKHIQNHLSNFNEYTKIDEKKPSPDLPKPKFLCDICNKTFISVYNLKRHSKIHFIPLDKRKTLYPSQKKQSCDICNKILSGTSSLRRHIKTHAGKSVVPYPPNQKVPCEVCKKPFIWRKMKKHLKTHFYVVDQQDMRKPSESDDAEEDPKSPILEAEEKPEPYYLDPNDLTCKICNETFQWHKLLVRHISVHFPNFICHKCGKYFACENNLKSHLKTHEQTSVQCDVCKKTLKNRSNLMGHLKIHFGGAKLNKCPHCPETFYSFGKKLTHLKNVHKLEPKKYQCKQCTKCYGRASVLQVHVRKVHLFERNYSCSVCKKRFYNSTALNHHMPSHTKAREFKCNTCDRSYRRRKSLVEHMKSHQTDFQTDNFPGKHLAQEYLTMGNLTQ